MKTKLIIGLIILLAPSLALAGPCDLIRRPYNTAATVNFFLLDTDGIDFKEDAAHASGDTVIMKDEGTPTTTTNGFTDEGDSYSLVLTSTEMEAARVVVAIKDQGTKAWLDHCLIIETYGTSASAQHQSGADVTKWNGTAVGTPDTAGYPVCTIKDGTGTGEIDTSSGTVTTGALNAGALNDFFTVDSGTTYASAVAGSVVAETADNAGGSALTVGAIADGVWDEAQSGHVTSGTFGLYLDSTVSAAGGGAFKE